MACTIKGLVYSYQGLYQHVLGIIIDKSIGIGIFIEYRNRIQNHTYTNAHN